MKMQPSFGKCSLCGGTFGKAAMTRHLAKCLAASDEGCQAFHLQVEGGLKAYWLHLAVSTSAHLIQLDQFLRDIWLECCGHMSGFKIGSRRYSADPLEDDMGFGDDRERSASVAAGKILIVGSKFSYEYDYGSTTELNLKVLDLRQVPIHSEVELLARNEPPSIPCGKCGVAALAKQICSNCVWSGKGWLCKKCARTHKCGEDMMLPVVNSPRAGVCAYGG